MGMGLEEIALICMSLDLTIGSFGSGTSGVNFGSTSFGLGTGMSRVNFGLGHFRSTDVWSNKVLLQK